MDGNYYTAVLTPEKDGKGLKLNVYSDILAVPSGDKTKLRVINASPDVGDIDIYVKGRKKAFFSGVGFALANGYDEFEPVTGALEARRWGDRFGYRPSWRNSI